MHIRLPRPLGQRLLQAGFLLWCLVAIVPTAGAQQVDSTLVGRFQLADSYLRAGQYDRAISLFEDLYAASPDTPVFYTKLMQAYEGVKRYDDAIALVDRQLQGMRTPMLLSEKARLLYQKGDEGAAFATWDEAIAEAPENQHVYRAVYQTLAAVRVYDRAIEILERGRERLGEPDLFQTDLATLYSLTGHHEQAMTEYLGLLAGDERQFSFVRSRLSRYLEQQGALAAAIAASERGVREQPLNRSFRELLAWLYLEAGQYRKALDTNRAIDRLEQENGRVLFAFAQRAADAEAYDVALDALKEIRERYPDAASAPEALFGLADMHERWAEKTHERAVDERNRRVKAPHYEAALESYRAFLQEYPSHAYYPEALRRIGRLQQDVFFELGEAEAALQEVVARYPNSAAADQANYDLGRIALLRTDLDAARLAFSRLEDRLRTGELAEQARYELALIHFYQGEFESALTLAQAINVNTSTDVANDAIYLKVLLIENKGPDSLNTPLQRFANVRLLQRQRRTDEALARVDSLLQAYGAHPLADDARFLRAELLRETGRAADALAAFAELPLLHPASYLSDRSLFHAAEIMEQEMSDKQGALQTYTRLLTEYPGSLLASEVRARIRLLRGEDA